MLAVVAGSAVVEIYLYSVSSLHLVHSIRAVFFTFTVQLCKGYYICDSDYLDYILL